MLHCDKEEIVSRPSIIEVFVAKEEKASRDKEFV
jgi:hypothetical protein